MIPARIFVICLLALVALLPTVALAVDGGGSYTLQLENPLKTDDILEFIKSIGKWLTAIAIPIAVFFIIYAGMLYTFWGFKQENVKKANDILKNVAIGLAIMLIGGGFISLIVSILNIGAEPGQEVQAPGTNP